MPYLSKTERHRITVANTPSIAIPRPMTKSELAEYMGVSERYLELEVKAGHLRAIRLSTRALRFMPIDIQSWLASKEATPVKASKKASEEATV